jgi:hypothetical protein
MKFKIKKIIAVMINRNLLVILSLMFLSLHAYNQSLTEKRIELPADWNSAISTYVARDYIKINPGFSFSGSTNDLNLRINENIIRPADYKPSSSYPTPENRTINTSLPIGSLPGAASVSPTGGAVYSVPIHVPPGSAGIQPNISLVYNSQSGDGLLGRGWNISGISSITRISQSHFLDDYVSGINFDDNDRFALDGNRLILVSGTYGKAGSVYRTEQETYQNISLFGTGSSQYFVVTTKDGHTLEYGNISTSRVTLSGTGKVLTWKINKWKDLNNCFIEYQYKQENGEIFIDKIKYTGKGVTPGDNTIAFYYDERSDKKTLYLGGGKMVKKHLLRQIKVFSFSELQKAFKFRYSGEKSSLLHEMTEYSPSGEKMNSTYLGWQHKNTSYGIIETASNPCGSINLFGDFNGDGRKDLLMHKYRFPAQGDYSASDKWRIYLGTESKIFSLAYEGSLVKGFKQFLIGDFDMDGDDDILMRVWNKHSNTLEIDCPESGTANSYKDNRDNQQVAANRSQSNVSQNNFTLDIPPDDGKCFRYYADHYQ